MGDLALVWVVGGGGLLGRAVSEAVAKYGSHSYELFTSDKIHWGGDDAPEQLGRAAREFREECKSRSWAVAWCAGAGIIGTNAEELARETDLLRVVFGELRDGTTGTVFLASSAGGVYGGISELPITEHSPLAPLSDYGNNKLVHEQLLWAWAEEVGGRGVIGRISNLYGPGQSLAKPQGLISQVCRAGLFRQPVSLYVPLDTIRDYLFADDCGGLVFDLLERGMGLGQGECRTKILASSRSISIGAILAEVRRVLGRKPSVVSVPSNRAREQGTALSFRSEVWPDLDRRVLTTLASGIDRTARGIRLMLGAGELSSLGGT